MISGAGVGKFFGGAVGKLDDWIKPSQMDEGFFGDIGRGAFNFLKADPSNAALGVGAAGGAAGGMLSNDRDQHWYTGAAQGAFVGSQMTKHGLSGLGGVGAAVGGIYGMMSDDTSIMTGAMIGAGAGAGLRYGKIGKQMFQHGDFPLKLNRAAKGQGMPRAPGNFRAGRPFRNPKNINMTPDKNGKVKAPQAASKSRRAYWGMNAMYNAAKRDLGAGWKVGRPKRGGTRTNKMGQQHRRSNKGASPILDQHGKPF